MPEKPDKELTATELQEKYDHVSGKWGEHPDYRMEAWGEAAADLSTRLGYWDWVVAQLEQDGDEDDNREDEC